MSHPSSHHSHQTEAVQAAWISVFITLLLVGLKTIGGILSGSLALLSLASESALDLFAVLLSLIAVRVAYLPADEDHPYGHGKFDVLVSLFQSILLLGVSVWIFIEAAGRLIHPHADTLEIDAFTFVVLIVSCLLDGWRSYKLHHAGQHSGSKALQTDALHFLVDGLSNIAVLIGILIYHFFSVHSADNYAALGVSAFVAYLSLRQGKEAIDGLTDRVRSNEDYIEIEKTLQSLDGVIGIRRLRMRHSGPSLFVDGAVVINRVLPFASVEYILSNCEQAVQQLFPRAEVNFFPMPIKTSSESAFETIKLVSSEYGVLPHNIELARSEGDELTLDLHLEFRQNSSFEEAHALSTKIENRIREELPQIREIVVHLEEERSDAELHHIKRIEPSGELAPSVLEHYILSTAPVKGVKQLELLRNETNGDLKLTVVIELDKTQSLFEAHEVSTVVEKNLRTRYPEINRIVIHAEPAE